MTLSLPPQFKLGSGSRGMGFLSRLKLGDPLGKKTEKSLPPLPSQSQQDAAADDTPIVIISQSSIEPPQVITPSIDDIHSSLSTTRKSRPAPLPIRSYDSALSTFSPLLNSPQNLVSASLAPSRSSGTVMARQRSDFNVRHDDEGDAELLAESLPREQTPPLKQPSKDSLRGAFDGEAYSYRGASRLLRRASEKFMSGLTNSKPSSRNTDQQDEYTETAGRSLASTSNVSLASIGSSRSSRFSKYNNDLLHMRSFSQEASPSSASQSVFHRSRALSTSSKEISPLLSSPAAFSKPFPRYNSAQADETIIVDLPSTPPSSSNRQLLTTAASASPVCEDEQASSSPRWRKISRKSVWPSTSSGVLIAPVQTYLLRLSPPPRGLAVDDLEGRRNLVCHYVQGRALEEKRKAAKGSIKRSSRHSTANSTAMEEIVAKLEEEFQQFMAEDIGEDADAQKYKELHLADVFIEARRCLGLDSMCSRLHSMFDIAQMDDSHTTTIEVKKEERDTDTPSTSPSPPSAWDTNPRKPFSLSPAPRKRRRPKTTPSDQRCTAEVVINRETPYVDETATCESVQCHTPSLDGSSRCSSGAGFTTNGSVEDSKDTQIHVLAPSLFSSRPIPFSPKSASSFFPPSPPRSGDSHRILEAESSPRPISKEFITTKAFSRAPIIHHHHHLESRQVLSEVLML